MEEKKAVRGKRFESAGHFTHFDVAGLLNIARRENLMMFFREEMDGNGDPVAVCELVPHISDLAFSAAMNAHSFPN